MCWLRLLVAQSQRQASLAWVNLFPSPEYDDCVQTKVAYSFESWLSYFHVSLEKNTLGAQYVWGVLGWRPSLYKFQCDVIKSNTLARSLEANGS